MSFKILLTYLLVTVAWSLYRSLISLPIWLEETLIKGLFFIAPILLFRPPSPILANLGLSRKNFFKSVSFGIAVGIALGLSGQVGAFLRHGQFATTLSHLSPESFGAFIILSLITAFWEQLLFSGYFLSQLSLIIKDELNQVLLVGLGFSLIHLPALILIQHLSLAQAVISSSLLLVLGSSCAILRLRLHNLIAPIMVHALWGITLFLFS